MMRKLVILTFIIVLYCTSLCAHRAYGDDTWTFAVVGDTRDNDPTQTGVSQYLPAIATATADPTHAYGGAPVVPTPSAVFVNGDLINGDSVLVQPPPYPDFATQFANWKSTQYGMGAVYSAGIPIYTVRGNHENEVTDLLPTNQDLKTAYYNAFGAAVPQNGPNDANSNGDQRGFTWNLSSLDSPVNQKYVRVIGMDQYFYYNSTAQGTSHYYQINQTWLNEQLLHSPPTRYTFVMAHEPAYYVDLGSGGTNPEGDFYGTTNPDGSSNAQGIAARDAFWNSLGANGVKMYLVCHVHNLQVGYAYDSSGNKIYQNMAGNGGAPLDTTPGKTDPSLIITYQNYSDYGFALYTVTKDNITINYYLYDYDPTTQTGTWSIADPARYSITILPELVNTWNTAVTPANFSTGTNWDVGAVPGKDDTAVFNNGGSSPSVVNFADSSTTVNDKLFVASGTVTFNLGTNSSASYKATTSAAIDGAYDTTNYRPILELTGVNGSSFYTPLLTMDGVSKFIVDPGISATCDSIIIQGATSTISGNINFTTLDVGTNNLTVTGPYTQPAGSTLKLTESSASNYGSITSGAGTTLSPASTVSVTVDSYIPNHTNFTVVNTGGTGIGNVPTTITSSSSSVAFSAANSGGNFVLTNTNNMNLLATNSNSANVGAVLDNITNPSADMTTVLNAMVLSSSDQVASSLNSMHPTADGALLQSAISMANQFNNALTTHLKNIQPGITGVSTGPDHPIDPNIWAQGLGDYSHQAPRGSSNGYNATSWGATGGADITYYNDSLHMGIASGYGQTFVRSKDSSGRTDIDSIPGTLYFNYENSNYPFYLDSAFTFIYNMYKGSRQITAGTTIQRTANADYKGEQYSAYFEGGYSFFYKNLRMTPLASVNYMHLHTGSYAESGADALDLSVNSQDYDMCTTGIGAKFAYPLELKHCGVTPDFHAKWLYDWIGETQATTSSFAGGGTSFGTSGFRPARSGYDLGIKLSLKTKPEGFREAKYNISLDLDYDFLLKADYYEHYGSVTVKYSF